MPAMRRGRLELVGVVVLGFVSGAFGVLVLPGRDVPVPPPAPVVALALGLGTLFAAAFATLLLVVRRNRGGERSEVRRAVERGALPDRLPEGMERTRLRNALESRFDALWSQRWIWPLLAGVQLLTGVPRVLDAGETPYARIFWSIAVVFWICTGIVLPLRSHRERPIVRRLLDELDRPQAADSTRID
jgi:hypothetical protein